MIATEAAAPVTNLPFAVNGKLNGKRRKNWSEQECIRTLDLFPIYELRNVASFHLRNADTKMAWFSAGNESTTKLD